MKTSFIFAGAVIAVAAAATVARSAYPSGTPSSPAPASVSFSSETASALATDSAAAFDQKAVESPTSLVVYVAGEVRRPGLYQLPPTARAQAALHAAGGPTSRADLIAVNLAEPLHDGEELVIAPRGAYGSTSEADAPDGAELADGAGDPSVSTHTTHRTRRHHHRRKQKAPSAPVDLNSADETQLESLPGIGPGLAARIVSYRELNGPFSSVDDLLDVGGITERKFQRLAPYVILH
ncbi:MAG TPA: helix-hairpin-helix domain-containing protein [Candidatus Acidoferrales bacterium]|nr:helix-hairpin-helix domain-containing protein [Candidatus Acidoferrales bacterium]